VWRIPQLQPASGEWSGYRTQKHHHLLERIIGIGSNPGDLVADFFSGSGTTLAVAQNMGRKWIGCDSGQLAIHTTRKRILKASVTVEDNGIVPVDLLVPDSEGSPQQRIEQIKASANSTRLFYSSQPEAGLPAYNARFEVDVDVSDKAATVKLTGFAADGADQSGEHEQLVVQDGMLVDRSRGKNGEFIATSLTRSWEDWVDYWAVDYDYAGPSGPFRPQWQSYRFHKNRKLELESAPCPRATPGSGSGDIAVQVVDIFGRSWFRVLDPAAGLI
jgi:hypothetical protein